MRAAHKVRRVEGHDCNLPQDDELITLYINGGLFVDLRRKFRKYLMVSASNPESKTVLKSTAQIRVEESRHLRKYYYMIHPFSQARISWEMIMIVVYSSLLIIMPIDLGILEKTRTLHFLKTLLDIISLIDITLTFFTGYYSVKIHRVIMKRRRVIMNYLLSYFITDLLSSLPYQLYVDYYADNPIEVYKIKYLYVLKLIRLQTLILYIRKFCIRLDIYSYKLSILNFTIWFLALIFWCTSVSLLMYTTLGGVGYTLGNKKTATILGSLIDSTYEIVRSLMLIQMNTIHITHPLPMCFNMLCIIIGAIINIVIIALVMQIFRRHFSSRNKYNNLIQEIGEYMNYKELPQNTKKRVFQYVEFKFQKNVFKEGDVLNTLSKILKQDILLHNCKKMIEKVDFFKGVPASLILRLVTKLKSEIYLPNDVVVQAGIFGNAMYFIYVGTVAVYTATHNEICHLEDGSHFGEIALIINEPRVATVIAITNCEVFKLSRRDFLEAIEPFPNLSDKIRATGLARLKKTQIIMKEEEESNSVSQL